MKENKNLIFRGYCTHSNFGDYKIPIPAQNIIYRDYCKKNNFQFNLSRNELFFQNSDVSLKDLIRELEILDGILMCSFFMLPQKEDTVEYLFDKILETETEIHFILENIVVKQYQDVKSIKDIMKMRKTIQNCSKIEIFKKYFQIEDSKRNLL